jgi:hypothetical protein
VETLRIIDFIPYTFAPDPNPLLREREQNLVPLLPREKGLGDEGMQSAGLLPSSLNYSIHAPNFICIHLL